MQLIPFFYILKNDKQRKKNIKIPFKLKTKMDSAVVKIKRIKCRMMQNFIFIFLLLFTAVFECNYERFFTRRSAQKLVDKKKVYFVLVVSTLGFL